MSELNQSIFRKVNKEDKFSIISNDLINDQELSYKATSILIYILSKPNDWQVYISDLVRPKDGEKSIRSGIKELIDSRYMQRYRVYDAETMKVHHWETLVSEEPFSKDQLISSVKEKYVKDSEGNILTKKITIGSFTRNIPLVLEREELLTKDKNIRECKKVLQKSKKVSSKSFATKIEKPLQTQSTPNVDLLSQNVHVGFLQVGNAGQQILTNTKTNKNYSSSIVNNMVENVITEKEQKLIDTYIENIGSLGKINLKKFLAYIRDIRIENEMIEEVIVYTSTKATKPNFAYFSKTMDSYITKNIFTKDGVLADRDKHNQEIEKKKEIARKVKAKNQNINNTSNLKFNNFDQRQYDYDDLEKKLLGWSED